MTHRFKENDELKWQKGTKIAIWGTGKIGRRVYLKYRHEYTVKYFIDNYPKETSIDNIPVVLPGEIKEKDIKILIGVANSHAIFEQCKEMGKKYNVDYWPYDFLDYKEIDLIKLYDLVGENDIKYIFNKMKKNKKTAIIIGNCQTPVIRNLLFGSVNFNRDYMFVVFPPIHLITEREEQILKKCDFVFRDCDLCITQNIADDNAYLQFLSTNSVKEMIGPQCRLVLIPTLYFDVYFPQTVHQREQIQLLNDIGILSFPYGDCILDELSKRYKIDEIIKIVNFENLFSEQFIKSFETMRIAQLKEKEKKCDIGILDYILERYKLEPLFYSKNHPKLKVIIGLVERLLVKLGYFDFNKDMIDQNEPLDAWQEVIYPSVAKALGLQFDKLVYRDCGIIGTCDFNEMVRSYVSYVHDIG